MNSHVLLAVAAGAALSVVSAHARSQWPKRITRIVNLDDELSIGMTLNSQGNSYVTGWFDGAYDFGGSVLTRNASPGKQDWSGTVPVFRPALFFLPLLALAQTINIASRPFGLLPTRPRMGPPPPFRSRVRALCANSYFPNLVSAKHQKHT